jgi:hypothetical protein
MYCLVRFDAEPPHGEPPAGLPNVGPVRLLDVGGGLYLVAADASREHYAEETIDAGLRDLDWVAERALAHESVVEHFLPHGDVLPFKLFTLFDSDSRAVQDLAARRPHIDAELARLSGCNEWEVRIAVAGGRSATPPVSGAVQDTPLTGTAFLERQRDRLRRRGQHLANARAAAEAALDELAEAARDRCRKNRPTQVAGEFPLECAFLLGAAELAAFKARVDAVGGRLGAAGLEVTLSGPWPPYHFVARSP